MTRIAYPLRIDHRGRTATADLQTHIRDLIEQLLFTAPGERVNRPSFGTNIRQAIFAPLSDELLATTEHLVQGALQQWLGQLIAIQGVDVRSVDAELRVTVRYTIRQTQQPQAATFTRAI